MADIIFDVDGTLMNIEHRTHLVRNKPKNWDEFFRQIVNDTPNHDIVEMAITLKNAGNRIIISSGRYEREREITARQLYDAGVNFDKMYLRANRDSRKDSIVKIEMLAQMREDGFNPTMAFDDRDQVVMAWRAAGLRCFQVSEGNF